MMCEHGNITEAAAKGMLADHTEGSHVPSTPSRPLRWFA